MRLLTDLSKFPEFVHWSRFREEAKAIFQASTHRRRIPKFLDLCWMKAVK
jgi:hypothetical protein